MKFLVESFMPKVEGGQTLSLLHLPQLPHFTSPVLEVAEVWFSRFPPQVGFKGLEESEENPRDGT